MKSTRKIGHMNEAAWLLGILLCSLGVALCTKAGFGLSMIAAPAYIFHRALIGVSPFFTQGTCEYLWQGLLLILMCLILKRFRLRYLLCFVTAFLFGMSVDGWFLLIGGSAVCETLALRIPLFLCGEVTIALAIALFFRTRLPLEVYELVVTEFADRYRQSTARVKQLNDIIMLLFSFLLSFSLHRSFVGIGIGTIIITLTNATLIALFGKLLDRFFDFSPRFPRLTALLGGS